MKIIEKIEALQNYGFEGLDKQEAENLDLDLSDIGKSVSDLQSKLTALQEQTRWIPADEPPEDIDWDKKVWAIEDCSEIPTAMTMAEIFLDENSDVTHWKPIILPKE